VEEIKTELQIELGLGFKLLLFRLPRHFSFDLKIQEMLNTLCALGRGSQAEET
jgi:hypothetical protein